MPTFTVVQLLELLEKPSTANHLAVGESLAEITAVPMHWDGPMDDASYVACLEIGDRSSVGKTQIVFSHFGDLAYVEESIEPAVPLDVVEKTLCCHGWIVVSRETTQLILYPDSGETVYRCFFSYT